MSLDGLTCMVADDSAQQRGRFKAVALKYGLRVVAEFDNGLDALAAIRKAPPDIALLDVVMGKMTGLEVAAALKEQEVPTKVILITAQGQKGVVGEHGVGIGAVLIKPFADEWFLRAVMALFPEEAASG